MVSLPKTAAPAGRKSSDMKHGEGGCAVYCNKRLRREQPQKGAAIATAKPSEIDVVEGTQTAKAKNARLRLMKERNENYLAKQRDENDTDDELTRELQVSTE
jgi:hypothetical protein